MARLTENDASRGFATGLKIGFSPVADIGGSGLCGRSGFTATYVGGAATGEECSETETFASVDSLVSQATGTTFVFADPEIFFGRPRFAFVIPRGLDSFLSDAAGYGGCERVFLIGACLSGRRLGCRTHVSK